MVTPISSLSMKKEKGDDNENTLGRIGVHNVVIACVPAGLMGNGPAAIVARDMQRSFPIKFACQGQRDTVLSLVPRVLDWIELDSHGLM